MIPLKFYDKVVGEVTEIDNQGNIVKAMLYPEEIGSVVPGRTLFDGLSIAKPKNAPMLNLPDDIDWSQVYYAQRVQRPKGTFSR
jgi:hypothetical protein